MRSRGSLALAVLLSLAARQAAAQTTTWTNANNDSTFGTVANWSAGLPNPANVAVLPTPVTNPTLSLTSAVETGFLLVNASGYTINLVAGQTSAGVLTLDNGIPSILSATANPTINIQGGRSVTPQLIFNSGSASNATITIAPTNGQSSSLVFNNAADAGAAVITNSGGLVSFTGTSAAKAATISNSGAGAQTVFSGNATAGYDLTILVPPTITNAAGGSTSFSGNASAGALTITNNAAGSLIFTGAATGSSATIVNNNAGGLLDISGVTGNGVTLGTVSGAGNIALGGNQLTIGSPYGSSTISGVISDGGQRGSLVIAGGSLSLPGSNAYAGGTTLNGATVSIGTSTSLGSGPILLRAAYGSESPVPGEVQFAADKLLLTNPMVLADAAVIDTQAYTSTLAGSVSGAGSLSKYGSGTLTLSGANSFNGGTTLYEGTLAVGNSRALGSGPLTMAENTTLQFTASGVNIGNAINLGLPANSGNHDICACASAGLGGGSFGTGQFVTALGNGTYQYDGFIIDPTIDTGPYTDTISSNISGAASLTKLGTGTLILTGTDTYIGPTAVQAGTLVVNGSAASSIVTLASGTVLGGAGSVGGIVAPSGATVAPGVLTPFSRLTVAGNVSFAAGSVYQVNINPSGGHDSLLATGTATLSGGTVQVLAASGPYIPGSRFTLLTAGSGVTGQFGSLAIGSNLAYLTPSLSYDANNVYLGFAQTAPLISQAMSRNQTVAAAALQTLPVTSPLYNAVVVQTPSGAQAALTALSGEIHASTIAAQFEDQAAPRAAVLDRLAQAPAPDNRFDYWSQAFASSGHLGASGGSSTLNRTNAGVIVGADHGVGEGGRVGLAAGYLESDLSADALASQASIDSTFVGLYGSQTSGALRLRAGGFYTSNQVDTHRGVFFPGFADLDHASASGDTLQGFAELGWRMPLPGATASSGAASWVEPYLGAVAIRVDTGSFTEQGGASALQGAAGGYDQQAGILGARANTIVSSDGSLIVHGETGWRHVFGTVSPGQRIGFVSAQGQTFNVVGSTTDRDSLMLAAGLDWKPTPLTSVGMLYSGSLGQHNVDNTLTGRVAIDF
jgi:autotransporter-associated beta strand protein